MGTLLAMLAATLAGVIVGFDLWVGLRSVPVKGALHFALAAGFFTFCVVLVLFEILYK